MMKNEIAIDYIGEHIKKYSNDIEIVNFVDNSMPKKYLEEVFPKIEIPEHISFFYEIRPDFEDEEILTIRSSRKPTRAYWFCVFIICKF